MNCTADTTAAAGAASASRGLDYRDLESELLTAVNMAEIACEQIESAQGKYNKTASGFHLSDGEMRLVSFAVYHASDLINALKKKWDAVHDDNASDRKVGAA